MLSLSHWQAAAVFNWFTVWPDTAMSVWSGQLPTIVLAEPVSPGWAP